MKSNAEEIDLENENLKRDVNHIHAEIRQLRNQQFLITTGSITLSGVVMGWLMDKKILLEQYPSVDFLFSVILVTLFFWGVNLKRIIDILSTYLKKRKWSQWEVDYFYFTQNTRTNT